ncbi:hypothetical protein EVAR_94934_1 [Eumeta japonica]|uniref:Uncharacterized protein n=1 Tax=Eumeta variegata TaxID=151549 RepID=A0A4C1Z2G2_EUMVA|nr:hypothetical protein EVAR_94934_1 [Eumeta japonica]
MCISALRSAHTEMTGDAKRVGTQQETAGRTAATPQKEVKYRSGPPGPPGKRGKKGKKGEAGEPGAPVSVSPSPPVRYLDSLSHALCPCPVPGGHRSARQERIPGIVIFCLLLTDRSDIASAARLSHAAPRPGRACARAPAAVTSTSARAASAARRRSILYSHFPLTAFYERFA